MAAAWGAPGAALSTNRLRRCRGRSGCRPPSFGNPSLLSLGCIHEHVPVHVHVHTYTRSYTHAYTPDSVRSGPISTKVVLLTITCFVGFLVEFCAGCAIFARMYVFSARFLCDSRRMAKSLIMCAFVLRAHYPSGCQRFSYNEY